ncbi:MAG: peptidoglycan DD-metalloendopeptidase family protein [Candidatus Thermoplasmatota archaeon]|nr:peptidoglycan DD-metalloendopeptidase family protein [Candidatus Thermoplasmatota archaeon]
MIEWEDFDFHPVVNLPDEYTILDLSKGVWTPSRTEFSIGKYNEVRPNMYNADIFAGVRNIHMGIDIGGPIGTPCMAFMDGEISHFGYNPKKGDYGYVVITRHYISGKTIWALYGHLDADSIEEKYAGQILNAGDIIGRFGAHHENGGWEPHLHLQLSQIEPETHDLPGVVAPENRTQALLDYPDPRLVLGPIY